MVWGPLLNLREAVHPLLFDTESSVAPSPALGEIWRHSPLPAVSRPRILPPAFGASLQGFKRSRAAARSPALPHLGYSKISFLDEEELHHPPNLYTQLLRAAPSTPSVIPHLVGLSLRISGVY